MVSPGTSPDDGFETWDIDPVISDNPVPPSAHFLESARPKPLESGSLGQKPPAALSHGPDKPSSELPSDLAKAPTKLGKKMQADLAPLSTRGTQTRARTARAMFGAARPGIVCRRRPQHGETRPGELVLPRPRPFQTR